jgi:putative methyltransferase (TIGR04325 family)
LSGKYPDWTSVSIYAEDEPWEECLKRVSLATNSVRSGEAPYQRDSVLFYDNKLPSSLMYILMNEAYKNSGVLNVVDFGGGLGGTYFHSKKLLPILKSIIWRVVEQPSFAVVGKNKFENDELAFYSSFEELPEKKIGILLFSGVLHYLINPYEIIEQGLAFQPDVVFVDRLPYVCNGEEDFWTLQIVPPEIFKAKVPMRIFNEEKLINFFTSNGYKFFAKTSAVDDKTYINSTKVEYSGYIFKSL